MIQLENFLVNQYILWLELLFLEVLSYSFSYYLLDQLVIATDQVYRLIESMAYMLYDLSILPDYKNPSTILNSFAMLTHGGC